MNCDGLRADIDGLKQELQTLEADIETIRKAEERSKELQGAMMIVDSDLSDAILEKYLKDFKEQNPEVFSDFTLGKRIDIEDANGGSASVDSVVAMDDGHVLIGGIRASSIRASLTSRENWC